MQKILFLHIGLPKTGTTSLQHYFVKNLNDNAAYLQYTSVGLSTNTGEFFAHHNLARAMSSSPRARNKYSNQCGSPEDFTEFVRNSQSNVPFLVSSEGFWGLLPHQDSRLAFLEWLTNLRRFVEVRILLTWRNPVEYLVSLYFETAKQKIPDDLSDIVERIPQFNKRFKNQLWFLSECADQVVLLRYTADMIGRYRALFRQTQGIDLPECSERIQANPSMNDIQKVFALSCSMLKGLIGESIYRKALSLLGDTIPPPGTNIRMEFDFSSLRELCDDQFNEFSEIPKVTMFG